MLKKLYRLAKWSLIQAVSCGKATTIVYVKPADIKYGQLPESQFPANKTYKFVRAGNWDKEVMPVSEHLLYLSYKQHFIDSLPWSLTPFYQHAKSKIESGEKFRGQYADISALNDRFDKCDQLYAEIKENGFKSNKDLYNQNKTNNILSLLDEITINISRDGDYILNDGWHRFVSALLLNLSAIPVRVLVRHAQAEKHLL